MLLIPCPFCGPRNQVEFTYGGDATVHRPAPDAPEAQWFEYVYIRDNPRGPHDELWLQLREFCRVHVTQHDVRGERGAIVRLRRSPTGPVRIGMVFCHAEHSGKK